MLDAVTASGGASAPHENLQIRARLANAALDRRALGFAPTMIARDLGLSLDYVLRLIVKRRHLGDPRALTDAEASARFAELDAAADKPVRALPAVVRRLRSYAVVWGRTNVDAAAGLDHLADLYEHHGSRLYPSLPIQGSDVVLTFIQPQLQHSACGSSALQCMDGA